MVTILNHKKGSKIQTPASDSDICDFENAQREVMLNNLPQGARETVAALEKQLDLDDGTTTIVTGILSDSKLNIYGFFRN